MVSIARRFSATGLPLGDLVMRASPRERDVIRALLAGRGGGDPGGRVSGPRGR